jgi:hypothetical protein
MDELCNTRDRGFRVETIGNITTTDGVLPIRKFVLNEDSGSVTVLLTGAVHGTEPAGAYALASLLRRSEELIHRFPDVCFHIVPVVNPWGFVHDHRFNERGINVGVDFTLLKSKEASIINAELKKNRYDLAIDLHEKSGQSSYIQVHRLEDVELFTPLVKRLESDGHELSQSPTIRPFRVLADQKGIRYYPCLVSYMTLIAERDTLPFFLMREGIPSFFIETGVEGDLDHRVAFAEEAIYGIVAGHADNQR